MVIGTHRIERMHGIAQAVVGCLHDLLIHSIRVSARWNHAGSRQLRDICQRAGQSRRERL